MNALVFNLAGSYIPKYEEADALRAAYLLAHSVESIGPAIKVLEAERNAHKGTLESKLRLVENYVAATQPLRGEDLVKQMRRAYKNLKRGVRNDAGLREAHRACLETFNKTFAGIHKAIAATTEGYAIACLAGLLDEEAFGFVEVDPDNAESGAGELLSDLLQLGLSGHGDDSCFCLPASFLSTQALKRAASSPWAQEGLYRQVVHIPSVHITPFEALQRLRLTLQEPAGPFRSAFNAWSRSPAEGEPGADAPDALCAAIGLLQQAIDRQALKGPEGLNVYAAKLPARLVWEGLRELKALPDASWSRLPHDSAEAALPVRVLLVQDTDFPPQRFLDLAGARSTQKRSLVID